jgi:hypothetical protein
MALLKTHSLDRQRDARFQSLLSISLEKWVCFIWNWPSLSMSFYILFHKLHKINAFWWHCVCQTTHLFHLWNYSRFRLNLLLGFTLKILAQISFLFADLQSSLLYVKTDFSFVIFLKK